MNRFLGGLRGRILSGPGFGMRGSPHITKSVFLMPGWLSNFGMEVEEGRMFSDGLGGFLGALRILVIVGRTLVFSVASSILVSASGNFGGGLLCDWLKGRRAGPHCLGGGGEAPHMVSDRA